MEKFRSSQLPTAYTVYHDNYNTATKKKKTYTNLMHQLKKTTNDNGNDKKWTI